MSLMCFEHLYTPVEGNPDQSKSKKTDQVPIALFTKYLLAEI